MQRWRDSAGNSGVHAFTLPPRPCTKTTGGQSAAENLYTDDILKILAVRTASGMCSGRTCRSGADGAR